MMFFPLFGRTVTLMQLCQGEFNLLILQVVRGSDLVGEVMRHGGAGLLVAVGGLCGVGSLGFVGFCWL
ncbi:hypothetical protein CMV_005676 [Castanea mollissima]|uniref:Uncharacterized protein n=1 Tax=Castanea mollissima TaxID=60419 RepID=A0A8J4RQP6_9ROSI|nr:hypothetical protein CMV_005676 [Castanea mollissima]